MAKLARASALQFAVNIGKTAVGALVTLYVVRTLGFGTFGQYALALALVNFLMIPTIGIRGATTKRMSEGTGEGDSDGRRDRYYTGGLLLQAALSLLFIGGIVLAAGPVNGYTGFNAVLYVASLFASISTARFFLSVLRGDGRVEAASLLEGTWSVTRSISQLVLVLNGGGVLALVQGELIAAATTVVVAGVTVDRSFAFPGRHELSRLYEYGRYAWFSDVKQMSYSWMDTAVLGFFVSPAAVGAYEVAWRISELFMLLPRAISKVVFPSLSNRMATGETDAAARILGRAVSFGAVLAIPGVVGAVLLGDGVLSLYGASTTELALAVPILILLSIGRIFESFERLLLNALNAFDYPNRAFRIGVVFSAINIILNVALVPIFDAPGAAVATSLSIAIGGLLAYRALPEDIGLAFSWRPVAAQTASALLMGVVLWGLLFVRPAETIPLVLGYVAVGAGIYAVGVVALSTEARARITQVLDETGYPSFLTR